MYHLILAVLAVALTSFVVGGGAQFLNGDRATSSDLTIKAVTEYRALEMAVGAFKVSNSGTVPDAPTHGFNVRYGASGEYYQQAVAEFAACNATAFGAPDRSADPVGAAGSSAPRECDVDVSAPGSTTPTWTHCADDGQVCSVDAAWRGQAAPYLPAGSVRPPEPSATMAWSYGVGSGGPYVCLVALVALTPGRVDGINRAVAMSGGGASVSSSGCGSTPFPSYWGASLGVYFPLQGGA